MDKKQNFERRTERRFIAALDQREKMMIADLRMAPQELQEAAILVALDIQKEHGRNVQDGTPIFDRRDHVVRSTEAERTILKLVAN